MCAVQPTMGVTMKGVGLTPHLAGCSNCSQVRLLRPADDHCSGDSPVVPAKVSRNSMHRSQVRPLFPLVRVVIAALLAAGLCFGAGATHRHRTRSAKPRVTATILKASVRTSSVPRAQYRKAVLTTTGAAPFIAGGPWTEPTYADSTAGDAVDG